MASSRFGRLRWGALVSCTCALVSVSLGVGQASAGSCNPGSTNFNFTLGTTNLCNLGTSLTGTGPNGLYVELTGTTANTRPVIGYASGGAGAGVIGVSGSTNSTGGYSAGVAGGLNPSFPAADAAAVRGVSYSESENGAGVWGQHVKGTGSAPGVFGESLSTAANASGVYGQINSSADYAAGVHGENLNPNCCGFGVAGFSQGQGIGIGGYAPNGFGVFGFSPYNWAAWLDGAVEVTKDLHVTGTLFKGAGAFRIDNPLDPAHSYLQHSFVESPQMKNVYDGNVTTNARGFATVQLPKWFQALNRDFRYQLTVIDKAHWTARAAVWEKIHDDRFTIRTDQGNVQISWQVTGVRHDPYANAHRIRVIVPKEGSAQGKYLHPQLYGQRQSKGETALRGVPHEMPRLNAP
jgi:hypothetical protein